MGFFWVFWWFWMVWVFLGSWGFLVLMWFLVDWFCFYLGFCLVTISKSLKSDVFLSFISFGCNWNLCVDMATYAHDSPGNFKALPLKTQKVTGLLDKFLSLSICILPCSCIFRCRLEIPSAVSKSHSVASTFVYCVYTEHKYTWHVRMVFLVHSVHQILQSLIKYNEKTELKH